MLLICHMTSILKVIILKSNSSLMIDLYKLDNKIIFAIWWHNCRIIDNNKYQSKIPKIIEK